MNEPLLSLSKKMIGTKESFIAGGQSLRRKKKATSALRFRLT